MNKSIEVPVRFELTYRGFADLNITILSQDLINQYVKEQKNL